MKLAMKFLLAIAILAVYDLFSGEAGIKERWNKFITWVKKIKERHMKKTKIPAKAIVLLIVAAGVMLFCASCSHSSFSGSVVKNSDSFSLDIEEMNGVDSHKLQLNAGDVLDVHFKTAKGKLYMKITSDGASLYEGNGDGAADFELNVTESGEYTVEVEGRHAAGKISVKISD